MLSQNYGAQHTLGRFRVMAVTGHDPLLAIPQNVRDVLAVPSDKRTRRANRRAASTIVPAQDKKVAETDRRSDEAREHRLAAKPVMKARVLAERTAKPRTSHMLSRGDFLQPEGEVQPGTLAVLPPLKPRSRGTADRLDLARWLVDPANPLVRRVMVNQLWSNLFGRGIVRTAERFRRARRAADASRVARLAGGRTDRPRLEPQGDDPPDRRLGHLSPGVRASARAGRRRSAQRLVPSAEPLSRRSRNRARSDAGRSPGLLSDKIGGPSVFPPLPPDIAELSYANNFKWNDSTGEDRYRRGMYTFFKRTAPHPESDDVRLPRREHDLHRAARLRTRRLQALATLNNESLSRPRRPWPGACCCAASRRHNDAERLDAGLALVHRAAGRRATSWRRSANC